MIVPLYSIRDKLSGFSWPTVDTNDQTAIRNFTYAVNAGNNNMSFSPGDYDLYKVGFFDSERGILIQNESGVNEFIISGTNVFGKKDSDVSG